MFYRDPYMLDLLGLKDTYSEKDLENAILAQLEKFILEMGSDFAFLAIHVAQYLTKMPPKEVLEKKLLQAIANAKEQLEQREE